MPLYEKLLATFNKALSTNAVTWTETSLHSIPVHFPTTSPTGVTVDFQIRLAPQLAKKPIANPAAAPPIDSLPSVVVAKEGDGRAGEVKVLRSNPFLPYDPLLKVNTEELYLPKHNLLLNKFSIVKGHVLLTTKDFESQLSPLNRDDFAAVHSILQSPAMPRYMCFFNCGANSGASQPHKHLQLLPESPEDKDIVFPPIHSVLSYFQEDRSRGSIGTPTSFPAFPCAHSITVLPPLPASPVDCGIVLEQIYTNTLTSAFANAGIEIDTALTPDSNEGADAAVDRRAQPSYNVVLTKELLLIVPRRAEKAIGGLLSLNSVAFAGMMLVKSEEGLRRTVEVGPVDVLRAVGFPMGSK
ncbi:ATP adenylyltransferase-domain-containing protein [Fimicolochytrium jonesii]|uniref:ATP adenylyltransferase-domain-containing protein n=1 Tax=Fimicolochytrium jonesii TaxID=1396493 RepID=UPI0022FECF85|nr:ATP adenylyltransferase-domain-containing protein [Fimicolochytrium jonesii]KAI8820453.1 ATP adenylyltransferase-domain-containing protein [Fimicolochytrium jonesii]